MPVQKKVGSSLGLAFNVRLATCVQRRMHFAENAEPALMSKPTIVAMIPEPGAWTT